MAEPRFTQTSSTFALTRRLLPDFRPIFEVYAADVKREAERLTSARDG